YGKMRISYSRLFEDEREPIVAVITFMPFKFSRRQPPVAGWATNPWAKPAQLKRPFPPFLFPGFVAAVLAVSFTAHAQTRVALVVGNSAYQKVVNLANPAHDAQDISESLKRLGFTVSTVTDANFDGFRRALRDFGRVAANADMAIFYYAGHGVEID